MPWVIFRCEWVGRIANVSEIAMELINETLDALGQVSSFDQLGRFAAEVCASYDIQNLAFQIISPVSRNAGRPLFITTYEPHWIQQYVSLNYFEIDPVVLIGKSSFLPLDWDEIDRTSSIRRFLFAEAESYGVGKRGITMPVRGPGQERSLITVTTFDSEDQWKRRRAVLLRDFHLVAYFLHERSLHLTGLRVAQRPTLSRREKQCLELLARGAAPKQIAYQLDLSISTVRLYLSSARLKLGAANKYEAIARAVQHELILI
ncbi:LuxR family transcriptional regulator [Agrobacterium vitis]|jgi:DNA-binding CsgD family transcriptional regulator|uniref:LuxR family transcriptional regulator n=2 Tax=Agrobacterium vitis TaxID=373 RepID=A0A6L6VJL0_AGRVI|nr:LuxR family transcriptional regulator [Agrobacterium vitis]